MNHRLILDGLTDTATVSMTPAAASVGIMPPCMHFWLESKSVSRTVLMAASM
jgi:hypothetical protein